MCAFFFFNSELFDNYIVSNLRFKLKPKPAQACFIKILFEAVTSKNIHESLCWKKYVGIVNNKVLTVLKATTTTTNRKKERKLQGTNTTQTTENSSI